MEIKRKGIIFALDAALAVSVVIIILINSSYYFSTSSKESLSQLQPVRIGSDIMALLDFTGNIEYALLQDNEFTDENTIPQENLNVSAYLPKNYAMKYSISDMKETWTIYDGTEYYCPQDGGVSGAAYENCKIAPNVRCEDDGCTLDQEGEWLKIKPFTEHSMQANIMNQGEHFVIVNTNQQTITLPYLALQVDDGIQTNISNRTNTSSVFDKEVGSYFYYFANTNPLRSPYFEAGDSPHNWITLTNTGTSSIQVKWVRVVGDESYSRSAFSSGETSSIPQDRFVGTGERFVSVAEPNGNFVGYHLVRYWIWLKTAGGS